MRTDVRYDEDRERETYLFLTLRAGRAGMVEYQSTVMGYLDRRVTCHDAFVIKARTPP